MNRKIFDQTNPFTVPEGYFDTLQDRIMDRIREEERLKVKGLGSPNIRFVVRTMLAAAACVLFIFVGAALYTVFTERQTIASKWVVDDDFYRWVYATEGATLLAESLDIDVPDDFMTNENGSPEEDDVIISFLERDNISVAAIAMFMRNNYD